MSKLILYVYGILLIILIVFFTLVEFPQQLIENRPLASTPKYTIESKITIITHCPKISYTPLTLAENNSGMNF